MALNSYNPRKDTARRITIAFEFKPIVKILISIEEHNNQLEREEAFLVLTKLGYPNPKLCLKKMEEYCIIKYQNGFYEVHEKCNKNLGDLQKRSIANENP